MRWRHTWVKKLGAAVQTGKFKIKISWVGKMWRFLRAHIFCVHVKLTKGNSPSFFCWAGCTSFCHCYIVCLVILQFRIGSFMKIVLVCLGNGFSIMSNLPISVQRQIVNNEIDDNLWNYKPNYHWLIYFWIANSWKRQEFLEEANFQFQSTWIVRLWKRSDKLNDMQ